MEKKKTNTIFILTICIIMVIAFGVTIYSITQRKKEEQKNAIQQGESVHSDLATISYEGTFQAKGVMVRVENTNFTLMPIIANEEYRNEENFHMENNSIQNLKQGQEVLVTFHYQKSLNEDFTYEPIAEKVEILKEKSDIEIPRDVLVKAYSTKENVIVTIDKEKSNNKQIVFAITDKNELKYDYSTMKYNLYTYNPPPEKQEVIYTENGAHTSGYNAWPELAKIAEVSTEANYSLNENGQVNVNINWSQTYEELKEGKYRFTLSTVNNLRQSIANPNVQEYPYDGVMIDINFNIDANGKIEIGEIEVR